MVLGRRRGQEQRDLSRLVTLSRAEQSLRDRQMPIPQCPKQRYNNTAFKLLSTLKHNIPRLFNNISRLL